MKTKYYLFIIIGFLIILKQSSSYTDYPFYNPVTPLSSSYTDDTVTITFGTDYPAFGWIQMYHCYRNPDTSLSCTDTGMPLQYDFSLGTETTYVVTATELDQSLWICPTLINASMQTDSPNSPYECYEFCPTGTNTSIDADYWNGNEWFTTSQYNINCYIPKVYTDLHINCEEIDCTTINSGQTDLHYIG